MSVRNHPRVLGLLAAGVAICAVSAPAFAQNAPHDDDEIVVSGELEAETGYKVTTGRSGMRTDTPLVDTPQSVSVVTARQIEDQGVNSIGDAVRYTPGIFSAQGEGNRETLVIRGMTTTGDFFVDGIRDDVQTYRDLYNIQRLEVFRGPNAMTFGRGGTGGLINRVTKTADWTSTREVRIEGGMYDHLRGVADLGGALNDSVALRITGVYQTSGSYRDGVDYERWGVNPTIAFRVGPNTLIQAGYEHFRDERVADRGVPSQLRPTGFVGAVDPLATPRGQFFGDPDQSPSWTNTDAANLYISHDFGGGLTLRNRTRYAEYDKFYQNVFATGLNTGTLTNPVGVPAGTYTAGSLVGIQAYNNLTERKNLVNQTDLNAVFSTGGIKHTLLIGGEFGRQETDNIGLDGLFPTTPGGATTVATIYAPVGSPQVSRPDVRWTVTNRGNNFGTLHIAAGYVQDQIEISPQLQIIAGVRYESLITRVLDRRPGGVAVRKVDNLWSPRAGLVFKPVENASIYASFSRSYLPRGGDQLTSLAPNNRNLDPERYDNYELGVKWDLNPGFNLTAAVYQLNRENVIVLINPLNAAAGTELGGGQRSRGFELGFTGQITPQLSVVGSYTYQDAEFVRAISATVQNGARIPNAPKHSASLWGRYEVTPQLGLALGASHQGERFAAQDNLVRLPGYTRVDAAAFYKVSGNLDLQVNVENLFGEEYFGFAHSNTNITPGAPVTVRGAISVRF